MNARIETDALFRSAHAALVFAANYSGQAYDRPVMNRMATKAGPEGKGLHGIDGAAQAGLILAELRMLGPFYEAILVADVAQETVPCDCERPCCSGSRDNTRFADAVNTLSKEVLERVLSGCISHRVLRVGLVRKFFGVPGITLKDLAKACDVSDDTAARHNEKITALLRKERKKAWAAFEERCRKAGWID